jgi:hypothetical protein
MGRPGVKPSGFLNTDWCSGFADSNPKLLGALLVLVHAVGVAAHPRAQGTAQTLLEVV